MSIHSTSSSFNKPLAWLGTCLLVFMLLLSQTMGLLHTVVHNPGTQIINGQIGNASSGGVDQKSQAKRNTPLPFASNAWLASLFSSHTGNADCRLYDQASHGSAVDCVAALVLPVLLQSIAAVVFQTKTPCLGCVAHFNARGPPLTR